MEDLENLYKKLENYSDFDVEDNCEKFLDTVDTIILQNNPNSIHILLKYFHDDSDYFWVNENMKNSLGYFSKDCYIKGILTNLEILYKEARSWLKSLIYPILNDEEYLTYFKDNFHITSKELLSNIFSEIYQESPMHRSIILDLQERLKFK